MNTKTLLVLLILGLSLSFHCKVSSNQPWSFWHSLTSNRIGSSVVLPLSGNVYPLGYYSVSLRIGKSSKAFDFDLDTGSDLTWVQCNAPCTGCTVPVQRQYSPNHNIVPCDDPLCSALHWPKKPKCMNPKDQCDYEVEYADHSSSIGALVIDEFPLNLKNGSVLTPRLAFGCGYDQQFPRGHVPTPTAGVIGLGKGQISILTQFSAHGLTSNVIGHCLSPKGGGFLFFGNDPIPSSGITWTPMSRVASDKHYMAGPAELLFKGKSTGLKNLNLIFDSGSSYTYFNNKAYQSLVNLIKSNLNGTPLKDAKEDKTLSVCWKGTKGFTSVLDVKNYFSTLTLSFGSGKKTQLQIPPESYLIISKSRNVCLGILDGTEVGMQNMNIIGDVFMQGIMMIFDNEKQQIGWVPANCDQLPKP